MNYFMWSAAAVMGLTSCVHLFLGTGDIMTPILAAETIHPVIRGVALVVWHMVTFILAMSTAAMIYLATRRNDALSMFVMLLQFGFAAIFLIVNVTMFGALFTMPQWTAFVLAGGLMFAGSFARFRKPRNLS